MITGLMDEFHGFFGKKKYAREIFTACAAFVSFCVACINVTPVRESGFQCQIITGTNILALFNRVAFICFICLTHTRQAYLCYVPHCLKQLQFRGFTVSFRIIVLET